MRRRIYLMRHAQVRYFEGVHPEHVVAHRRGPPPGGVRGRRAHRRPVRPGDHERAERTLETARIVAPGRAPESRYGLREIESGDIRAVPPDEVQAMMTAAFRGVVPPETRFLGGETIGALVDRVLPELDALLADDDWDVALLVLHGAVNRAILSRALTGERVFLGGFEQAPGCINVLDVRADGEWIVRAVNHPPTTPPTSPPRARRRWSSSGRNTSPSAGS